MHAAPQRSPVSRQQRGPAAAALPDVLWRELAVGRGAQRAQQCHPRRFLRRPHVSGPHHWRQLVEVACRHMERGADRLRAGPRAALLCRDCCSALPSPAMHCHRLSWQQLTAHARPHARQVRDIKPTAPTSTSCSPGRRPGPAGGSRPADAAAAARPASSDSIRCCRNSALRECNRGRCGPRLLLGQKDDQEAVAARASATQSRLGRQASPDGRARHAVCCAASRRGHLSIETSSTISTFSLASQSSFCHEISKSLTVCGNCQPAGMQGTHVDN